MHIIICNRLKKGDTMPQNNVIKSTFCLTYKWTCTKMYAVITQYCDAYSEASVFRIIRQAHYKVRY